MTDTLIGFLQELNSGLSLKYNKFDIGLAKNGLTSNFILFCPKKDWLRFEPRSQRSDEGARFVFVPDRCPDEVNGHVEVDAAGPPGVLQTVHFANRETDAGLDVAKPIVVEGVLEVIRHPAWGQFPAVIELQGRESRLVAVSVPFPS